MILEERRQKIAELVSRRGYLPLLELVQLVGVSESTVRRDLDVLHESGQLRRTHGGAIAIDEAVALPAFEDRKGSQHPEKEQIAELAAHLIRDDETVLIDGGTTTYELARRLIGRKLQVVTNSLPIANLFANSRGIDLILIGGYVYPKTGVALGALATSALRSLHVDRVFMSCGGITSSGLHNDNLLLVETQQAMMAAGDETIVLADRSKFGRQALILLDDWSHVRRLVVDSGVTTEQLEMAPSSVKVSIAGIGKSNQVPNNGVTA